MPRRLAPYRPAAPLNVIRAALSGVLCAAVVAAPLPASAAIANVEAAAPAASGTIGLMRFDGDAAVASDLRSYVQSELEAAGYTIKGVALDMPSAAKKVKCREVNDDCLAKIAAWLAKGKDAMPYDYLVYGTAAPADSGKLAAVVVYDLAKKAKVTELRATFTTDDYILPVVLPRAMARAIQDAKSAPAPITPDEEKILAELDEGPGKTPEELRAEQRAIAEAQAAVDQSPTDAFDTSGVKADLKADFDKFCRNEKRRKRASKEEPPDLRPNCKLGPFWGYWQNRAWVALGLTGAGALATLGLYGLGLGARGPYKEAVDVLESSGLSNTDPLQSVEYTALASDVAAKGASMRRLLVGGDIALGATVLLAGVLAVIIYQDRTDAKRFIRTEKSLRAISKIQDVQVGPILGAGVQGAGLGFRF
jgi:hypothetical protein